MSRGRRLLRTAGWVLAGLFLLNGLMGIALSRNVARQIRTYLPAGTKIERVRWSFPFGVRIDRLSIPDPGKKNPFFLKADRVVLQIPWWGLLARPLPARVALLHPQLKIGSDNLDLLIGGMAADPNEWLQAPFAGVDRNRKGPIFRRMPFIPYGFDIVDARVEVIEPEIRAEYPVFIADHVNLTLGLTFSSLEPTIHLVSRGDFVTERGEKVGFQKVDILCQPRRKKMEGSFRLRHERLADFRNLYQYAPRPVFIEGGIADFSLQFTLTDGKHLKMTAHCLVQSLDLDGKVGQVSWADIMHAVEDSGRLYEWTVPTEGDLDDPSYNPHDFVLSEVEWKMKEKASTRGLQIPGQMFFYADTPEAKRD